MVVEFARWAIAPLIPTLAMLAKSRRRLAAVPRPERRAPEVDDAALAAEGDLGGLLDLARDPEGADEVPARPARHDRDLRRLVEAREPVHDLVDRAVATHDDEQLRATRRGLARELGEVTLPLAQERVALEAGRRCAPCQLGPAPPGRAVRRRGVDEEDDAVVGRGQAVTVVSASSVI